MLQKIDYLANINTMLMSLLGSEELINTWWKSSNFAFDLMTPEEMWDKDPTRVMGYIESQFK